MPTDLGQLDLDLLDETCDERTHLVSLGWIGYTTGYRQNLAAVTRIAHDHGVLMFLDIIQGLSAFPLDVATMPIDFVAADGHRWLLGPEGAGIFFMTRKHLDLLRPLGIGWHSVIHAIQFRQGKPRLKPTSGRYEGRSLNMAGFLTLGASLEMLSRMGTSQIAERLITISDFAREQLREIGE